MGLLSEGSAALDASFRRDDDVQVTYALGGGSYRITVYAGIGAQTIETEPGVFVTQRTSNRDFLIDKSDIVFFADTHQPSPGDQIIHVGGDGETYTYEVMEVPGEGAWRWHDEDYGKYRIHTTLVKAGLY